MKIILQTKDEYILRYDKEEELIGGLTDFCQNQKIEAGFFFGIGAAKEIELSFYDIDKKEYLDKEIKEKLEIISLQGNIAEMGEKIIIHCHGSFSDSKMEIIAGHAKRVVVSATCEVILKVLDGKIEREYSPEIGLNLMK